MVSTIGQKQFLKTRCCFFLSKMSALAPVRVLTGFPIGHFMLPITDTDIGSLKSLHTLFNKYVVHMLVKI